MKKTILLGFGIALAFGATAAPLTPEQALERMQQGRMGKISSVKVESQPVFTQMSATGVPTLYVFNCPDNGGYRILSADDIAYAVLGYSETGSFDPGNMPSQLAWWLKQNSDMIAFYAGSTNDGQIAPAADDKQRIEPLCKSKWDQGKPYYNDCPKSGNRSTYTGCVATSMAQVMYYHKYPEVGEGSHSYSWKGKTLSMDFSETPFDWDNMLDVYQTGKYTTTQSAAVAHLMKSCGYSMDMNYGTESSGTQGVLIANALKTYFKYDGNCNVKWRMAYSAAQWADIVYDNLMNVGPVIFNGHEYESSGHSFVCDGYDGRGYYHINWGWGGLSDGWFSLEALNPSAQSTGGGVGSGFNYGLNGIFGIQPPTGEEVVTPPDNMLCYGGVTATMNGRYIEFAQNSWYPQGWYDAMDHEIKVNMGITIEPVDGTEGEVHEINGTFGGNRLLTLQPGYYYGSASGPRAPVPTLTDGRYKVTITIRDMKKGAPETRVPIIVSYGCPNYVYLNVSSGVQTVENVDIAELVAENLVLDSELYSGCNARYKATLKNSSEFELTETIVPALLKNGKIVMLGNQTPTTIAPKSEGEVEWICKMVLQGNNKAPTVDTEYELAIVNPVTSEILGRYGNVTMKPKPATARLVGNSFIIEGATAETVETNIGNAIINTIETNHFNTVLKYTVDMGFFDGVISYSIYKRAGLEDYGTQELMNAGIYSCQPLEAQGAENTLNVPIDFAQAEVGSYYVLRATYTAGNSEKLLMNVNFTVKKVESGVVEGEVENNDAPVRYFNMQGIEINEPVPGQIVIVRQGNVSRKVRF